MDSLEEMQIIAYHLWEEEGRPEGKDIDHWLRAEQIVRNRIGERSALKQQQTPAKPQTRQSTSGPQSSRKESAAGRSSPAPKTQPSQTRQNSPASDKRKTK